MKNCFSSSIVVEKHIELLRKSINPKNSKGEEFTYLEYKISDEKLLNSLLDSFLINKSFQGTLVINSPCFNDINGFKIYEIILQDKLSQIKISNKYHPFSDKISTLIGKALFRSKNLVELEVFLKIDATAHQFLSEFLKSNSSKLKKLKYLELNEKYLMSFKEYLNKKSVLEEICFYYTPLEVENLLYSTPVKNELISNLADKIQLESNLTDVDIISIKDDFEMSFNFQLVEDIKRIKESINYACQINKNIQDTKINIDDIYTEENDKMNKILANINNIDDPKIKNSVISIRSYLNRTIGELLNNALYELEIQRERSPDNEELKTAKGSIKFIAKFLIERQQQKD